MQPASPPSAVLPALEQHRWLRFATFTVFYIAQGFPIGLFNVAMPAWLLANGMSTAAVAGFVGLTGLPWATKIVVAPLMDRYQFLPMGRRRPWVLLAQTGAVLSSLLLLLVQDPSADFWLLTIAATAINAFAATQDVAVDGMAIDVLPSAEQGRANAFMMGGQVFGLSLSGAFGATLLAIGGVPLAGAALTLMILAVSILSLLFRERTGERLLPWSAGVATLRPDLPERSAWGDIVRNLLRVLLVPMSLLLIGVELLFRAAAGVGLVMFPDIAVRTLGYSASEFAQYVSLTSAIGAFVGLAYGPLIDRFGADRMLTCALVAVGLLFAGFGLAASFWQTPGVAAAALLAADVFGQCVMVAMIAQFMSACAPAVAASQFAVYMTTANLARSAGAASYPLLGSILPVHGIFFVTGAMVLIAALCMTRFNARGMVRTLGMQPLAH